MPSPARPGHHSGYETQNRCSHRIRTELPPCRAGVMKPRPTGPSALNDSPICIGRSRQTPMATRCGAQRASLHRSHETPRPAPSRRVTDGRVLAPRPRRTSRGLRQRTSRAANAPSPATISAAPPQRANSPPTPPSPMPPRLPLALPPTPSPDSAFNTPHQHAPSPRPRNPCPNHRSHPPNDSLPLPLRSAAHSITRGDIVYDVYVNAGSRRESVSRWARAALHPSAAGAAAN